MNNLKLDFNIKIIKKLMTMFFFPSLIFGGIKSRKERKKSKLEEGKMDEHAGSIKINKINIF